MDRRWMVRIFAATVAVLIAVVGSSTAANAATGPGGHVITCTVSLDNPHPSGHVRGTISAQGRVNCTSGVAEIYVKTTLTNLSRATSASQTDDRFNVSSAASVGAKSCSEGGSVFQSKVEAVVHFPAGYTPQKGVLNKTSNRIGVTCGNARAKTPEGAPVQSFSGDDTTEWVLTATAP